MMLPSLSINNKKDFHLISLVMCLINYLYQWK